MVPKIIVVGAGKGGVGKTFVSTNLAITLSKLGHSTLVIDFDLAGANIHTTLGCQISDTTLLSYLSKEQSLSNLVQPTSIPRLSYIQGVWDNWSTVSVTTSDANQFVTDIKKLNYDYVIIDLGPGATAAHLEIFKNADEKILVTSAEPTSIEKTYRFVESYIVSQLQSSGTKEAIERLKIDLKKYRNENKKGHFSFRSYLTDMTGFTFDHFDSLNSNQIRLIMNGTRSHQDQQLGFSIKSVCNKYFDLAINYTGFIDYDNAVWQSVRNKEPFLIKMPFTPLSGQFLSICKNIISSENTANQTRAVV